MNAADRPHGNLYVLALIDPASETLAGFVGGAGDDQVVADPVYARKFSTYPDAIVRATFLSLLHRHPERVIEVLGFVPCVPAGPAPLPAGGGSQ